MEGEAEPVKEQEDRFYLKTTLAVHKSDVCTLTALPNGYLASAGGDRKIRITNPETEEIVTSFKGLD